MSRKALYKYEELLLFVLLPQIGKLILHVRCPNPFPFVLRHHCVCYSSVFCQPLLSDCILDLFPTNWLKWFIPIRFSMRFISFPPQTVTWCMLYSVFEVHQCVIYLLFLKFTSSFSSSFYPVINTTCQTTHQSRTCPPG